MGNSSLGATPSLINIATRLGIPNAVLDNLIWQLLCDLRVAVPGIVQSYNASKNTATVQIAIRENLNIGLVPTPTAIKPLVDVPVIFGCGNSKFAITLPVVAGDECWLVFGDNCYNAWWANGGVQNQEERRRHDLSDAVAFIGLFSQPNLPQNISSSSLQVRSFDGNAYVQIDENHNITIQTTGNIVINATGSGQVTVESASSVTVNAPTVTIEGGGTSIDAKNFLNHKHSGVASGGSDTGPVV